MADQEQTDEYTQRITHLEELKKAYEERLEHLEDVMDDRENLDRATRFKIEAVNLRYNTVPAIKKQIEVFKKEQEKEKG